MAGKIIETERLRLRPWGIGDAADCARLIGDIEVSRWLTVVPHPYVLADAAAYIRDGEARHRYCIEIDGHVAGGIGVYNHLGYWLGVPFWGKGYMSEAARAAVAGWFSGGGGNLASGYFDGNTASRRVLERLGFRPTNVLPTKSCATGEVKRLQNMVLCRASWQVGDG